MVCNFKVFDSGSKTVNTLNNKLNSNKETKHPKKPPAIWFKQETELAITDFNSLANLLKIKIITINAKI